MEAEGAPSRPRRGPTGRAAPTRRAPACRPRRRRATRRSGRGPRAAGSRPRQEALDERRLPEPASPVTNARRRRPASASASASLRRPGSRSRPTMAGRGGSLDGDLGDETLARGSDARQGRPAPRPAAGSGARASRSAADGWIPSLLVEPHAGLLVGGERVRLAAAAVQREDLLARRRSRRCRDERVQLRRALVVPPQREVRLEALLERLGPELSRRALHVRTARRRTPRAPRRARARSRRGASPRPPRAVRLPARVSRQRAGARTGANRRPPGRERAGTRERVSISDRGSTFRSCEM